MIHIVTTWDTESPCHKLFKKQACYQRDWVDASGIIMETCEKYNIPATFMINVGEIGYWYKEKTSPESVIRQMVSRGHDAQVHLHPAWAYWWCQGNEPYYDCENDPFDDGLRNYPVGNPDKPWTQRFFIRKAVDILEKITGKECFCYRDSNYDVNDSRLFFSLYHEGILSDWSMQKGFLNKNIRLDPDIDELPCIAFWPDLIEVRKKFSKYSWPVLEVPNTVLPGTNLRFDFQQPYKRLIQAFDEWYKKVKDEKVAICSFLNHQKREIYDADVTKKPWKPAEKKVLENMNNFFIYIQENYIDKKMSVKFSSASDATKEFIKHNPKFEIPEWIGI